MRTGQVAVVTGAGSGIGLAIAQRVHAEGMHVVLADRDEAALHEVRGALDGAGEVLVVPTDVTVQKDLDELVASAVGTFGQIDLICNNVGVQLEGLSWELPLEVWRWILDVNLMGVTASEASCPSCACRSKSMTPPRGLNPNT